MEQVYSPMPVWLPLVILGLVSISCISLCAFIHLKWSKQMTEFTRIAMAERVRYLVKTEQEAKQQTRDEDEDDFHSGIGMGGNRTLDDEVDG